MRLMNQGGFSLLEVLISLLVLAIAITSILALFALGSSSYTRAEDYANLSMVAELAYTDVLNYLRENRTPANLIDRSILGYPNCRCDATFEPLGADRLAYILRLKVKWLAEGAQRSEEFTTIVLSR